MLTLNRIVRAFTVSWVFLVTLTINVNKADADDDKPVIVTDDEEEVVVIRVPLLDPKFKDKQTFTVDGLNSDVDITVEQPSTDDQDSEVVETVSGQQIVIKTNSRFGVGVMADLGVMGHNAEPQLVSMFGAFVQHDSKRSLVRAKGGLGGCHQSGDDDLAAGFDIAALVKLNKSLRVGFGFDGKWCVDTGAPAKELVMGRELGPSLQVEVGKGHHNLNLSMGMGWYGERIPGGRNYDGVGKFGLSYLLKF